MTSRPVRFPWGTLAHLSQGERDGEAELTAISLLEGAGVSLGLLAIPAAVEDGFYRYNDLPRRLAALYRGLDPADPDEDILEEAEPEAAALLGSCYLLDDVVDAFLDALAAAPAGAGAGLVVRRAGASGPGVGGGRGGGASGPPAGGGRSAGASSPPVGGGRNALLAMKRLYVDDWGAASVAARLSATGRIGLNARPVLVHGGAVAAGDAGGLAAVLGGVGGAVSVDALGAVVGVSP